MLDAQDGNVQLDQQGNIIQPSLAFCQALDNEQEYDDVDAVAGTTLRGVCDPADVKPSRLTEVLVAPLMHVSGVCHKITYNHMSAHQPMVWHAANARLLCMCSVVQAQGNLQQVCHAGSRRQCL